MNKVAGLTTPEFQEIVTKLIQAIGRATQKSCKTIWGWVVRGFRHVERKWAESGELDRRTQARMHDYYARSFHHLRCAL
ncbi:hypothetical protein WDW37_07285 [Bdellovibrionota bacterium FG-1]